MADTSQRQENRYDSNRRVKMILVRHGVNLSLLKWSSSRTTAYFYGELKKESEQEFTISSLDALLKDLHHSSRIARLSFNLDNWDISGDSGSFHITKKRKPAAAETGLAVGNLGPPVVIRKVERTEDILREIREKQGGSAQGDNRDGDRSDEPRKSGPGTTD